MFIAQLYSSGYDSMNADVSVCVLIEHREMAKREVAVIKKCLFMPVPWLTIIHRGFFTVILAKA